LTRFVASDCVDIVLKVRMWHVGHTSDTLYNLYFVNTLRVFIIAKLFNPYKLAQIFTTAIKTSDINIHDQDASLRIESSAITY
jgi:hypothetical protein